MNIVQHIFLKLFSIYLSIYIMVNCLYSSLFLFCSFFFLYLRSHFSLCNQNIDLAGHMSFQKKKLFAALLSISQKSRWLNTQSSQLFFAGWQHLMRTLNDGCHIKIIVTAYC